MVVCVDILLKHQLFGAGCHNDFIEDVPVSLWTYVGGGGQLGRHNVQGGVWHDIDLPQRG